MIEVYFFDGVIDLARDQISCGINNSNVISTLNWNANRRALIPLDQLDLIVKIYSFKMG